MRAVRVRTSLCLLWVVCSLARYYPSFEVFFLLFLLLRYRFAFDRLVRKYGGGAAARVRA